MVTDIVQLILERERVDPVFRHRLHAVPLAALEDYPLTEDERVQLVLPGFGWVVEHRLALTPCPRSADAMATLRALGVTALLDLSGQPRHQDPLPGQDLEIREQPLWDFSAPTLGRVVGAIDELLDGGLVVAIHGGRELGRAGTALACYRVRRGEPAAAAIAALRSLRPDAVGGRPHEAAVAEYESARVARNGSGRP